MFISDTRDSSCYTYLCSRLLMKNPNLDDLYLTSFDCFDRPLTSSALTTVASAARDHSRWAAVTKHVSKPAKCTPVSEREGESSLDSSIELVLHEVYCSLTTPAPRSSVVTSTNSR